MKKHIIEIIDPGLSQKSHVDFFEQDLFEARKTANGAPVTPIIVKMIHGLLSEKGFRIKEDQQSLFKIARNLLLDDEGLHKIHARFVKKRQVFPKKTPKIEPEFYPKPEPESYPTPETSESYLKPETEPYTISEPEPYPEQTFTIDTSTPEKPSQDVNLNMDLLSIASHPLFCLKYDHAIDELSKLMEIVHNNGKIPILWRKSKGFVTHKSFNNYSFVDPDKNKALKEPAKMIQYILSTQQDRVVYIVEDFHHYIGAKDTVNPQVGDVRSLIKELHDELIKRSEHLIFFVPDFYELPEELEPYIQAISKKQAKKAKGYLDRFGQLLSDPEYIRKCKPVIGVDNLITRMIQILGQMESNNPLLIGSPGVGKTAIVEGFAKVLLKGNLIPQLAGRNLYSLSLNSMVAGTRYRGDFEIRLEGLMDEVLQNKDRIIVFIDEIHTLIDAGSSEGAFGAADVLKPVLARGEFPCIGATTPEGVRIFSKDPALSRRFKKIWVNEPDLDQTFRILKGITGNIERHHQLKMSDDALKAAVELSKKYVPEEFLPGKAVSLIDGAAAFCRINKQKVVRREDVMKEMKRFINENKERN
ncbi:magnetosome protein Mad27-1 [Candidatus Magnetomorum sp. HK-1]|nr:magnetosome protein Mad27-1 [Candidatus Magnetomorum sp. HK-1]